MSNLQTEVKLTELINELEYLPSHSNLIVERVPIEYADFTYKVTNPKVQMLTLNQAQTRETEGMQDAKTQSFNPNLGTFQSQIENRNDDKETNIHNDESEHFPDPVFTPEEFSIALDEGRFFIIRSSNQENIQLSKKHEEWATTKANENKLNEAFLGSKYVFLIFTVSKTFYMQGLAVLISRSSNSASAIWKSNDSIKLGGSFKVKWISYYMLAFNRIGNMTNSYSDNELVKKSRDCTELDPQVGKEISALFEIPFREPKLPNQLNSILEQNIKLANEDFLSQNLTKAQLIEKILENSKSVPDHKKDKKDHSKKTQNHQQRDIEDCSHSNKESLFVRIKTLLDENTISKTEEENIYKEFRKLFYTYTSNTKFEQKRKGNKKNDASGSAKINLQKRDIKGYRTPSSSPER